MPAWLASGAPIDWIALLGSLIAIGISVYALRQGARFRNLDRQTDAAKRVAEVRQRLEATIADVPAVKRAVEAMFAANGMLRSEACRIRQKEIDAIGSKAADLLSNLQRDSANLRGLSGQALEERMVSLWSLKLQADELVSTLEERKDECRKSLDERRARNAQGFDRN